MQYYNESNWFVLFKYYWYDTTNREISVDSHHGLVKINIITTLHNVNDAFFSPKNTNKFITHTLFLYRKYHFRIDWLSIVKTKFRGRVQVVQDGNDKITTRDDIFQLDELVDPYWVVPSTNLEENLIFCVTENLFVVVNIRDLNDILRTNRHT